MFYPLFIRWKTMCDNFLRNVLFSIENSIWTYTLRQTKCFDCIKCIDLGVTDLSYFTCSNIYFVFGSLVYLPCITRPMNTLVCTFYNITVDQMTNNFKKSRKELEAHIFYEKVRTGSVNNVCSWVVEIG